MLYLWFAPKPYMSCGYYRLVVTYTSDRQNEIVDVSDIALDDTVFALRLINLSTLSTYEICEWVVTDDKFEPIREEIVHVFTDSEGGLVWVSVFKELVGISIFRDRLQIAYIELIHEYS